MDKHLGIHESLRVSVIDYRKSNVQNACEIENENVYFECKTGIII